VGRAPSLAHPGGNITGFSYLESTIGAKWVELLKEIAAPLAQVALVFNPESSPYSRLFLQSIEAAAPSLAVKAIAAPVREPADLEQAVARLVREPGSGAIFSADGFIYTNRKLIIELAARYRLPAIYGIPGTAAEGGLIYYCVDTVDSYRKAAVYVDRILRGEKPGDLPVQQPTQFQLSVNRKTAGRSDLRCRARCWSPPTRSSIDPVAQIHPPRPSSAAAANIHSGLRRIR